MHRKHYEERLAECLTDILSRVDDINLHRSVLGVSKLKTAWEFTDGTQKSRLIRYTQTVPTNNFDIVEQALAFEPLKTAAQKRIARASLVDLGELIPFAVPEEVIDRAIALYHTSDNFDEANTIAKLIQGYAFDFSAAQIDYLFSRIATNNQITGSFELPHLLKKMHAACAQKNLNIEELLRKHGLEKYSSDVSSDVVE